MKHYPSDSDNNPFLAPVPHQEHSDAERLTQFVVMSVRDPQIYRESYQPPARVPRGPSPMEVL